MGKPAPVPKPPPLPTEPEVEEGGGGGSSYWSSGSPQSFAGFKEFAKTGGFSAADLANIRARAVSPVRAVYANAQREVNRSKAIQGGYSPGHNVLQARMAREQGQSTSDAATDAEAAIAKMVQEGKLAGLQGMAGTEGSSGGSSGGGGGGGGRKGAGEDDPTSDLVPEKKKGFWGKLGSGLKKVGQIALPVLAGSFTGGLAAPLTAGLTRAGQNVGKSLLPKGWG